MMDQLIMKFPAQLKKAIEISQAASVRPHHFPIYKAILCGMGSSGIGGAVVADLIADECSCPYTINNSYTLPAFVDKYTLMVISSYSGNTEETISALSLAISTGAKVICITSGGKMMDVAITNGLDCINFPDECVSPRACIGFSMVAQLCILQNHGLISGNILDNLRIAVDLITFEQEDIISKAQKIATLLYKKTPVIYAADRAESVALRWRQQFNENAKILSWHSALPEMNHNELEGWKSKHEDIAVIFLRYKDDQKRIQVRMDLTKKIVNQYVATVIEIYSKGQSLAEKVMYMIHFGDWVSLYLAQLNHVDASEISAINFLKAELKKSAI
jgi:glucose/mannose-6-phosphate isomerase